jgi:Lon protease-like protein
VQPLLPLFPLPLVLFENEAFRLHIFEPRYKAMLEHVQAVDCPFVVACSLEREIQSLAAKAELISVDQVYEDGSLDITCRCTERVALTDVVPATAIDKYDQAKVETLSFVDDEDKELHLRLKDLLVQIYELSQVGKRVPDKLGSYLDWVHKCGMDLKHEYEMAALTSVSERQLYALNHLKNLLYTLEQVENMKNLVHLNGHAKRLSVL